MEELILEKTVDTPQVELKLGDIKIVGRSIPEHVNKFYDPIMNWIKSYLNGTQKNTKVFVSLEYANSCSYKYLNDIFKTFEGAYKQGHEFEIKWEYEEDDDSIYEIGEDIQSLVNIPFEFIQIKREKRRALKVRVKKKSSGKESIITDRYWQAIVRNGHGHEYELLEELSE